MKLSKWAIVSMLILVLGGLTNCSAYDDPEDSKPTNQQMDDDTDDA